MSDLFLKVVNMSISATYLALAVLVLRLVLKNQPQLLVKASNILLKFDTGIHHSRNQTAP